MFTRKVFSLFILTLILISCAPLHIDASPIPIETQAPTRVMTSTLTLTPTVTYTPTLPFVACQSEKPIVIYQEIVIFFHDKNVSREDCRDIQWYTSLIVENYTSAGYPIGSVEIHVSTDPMILAQFLYDIGKKSGCNPDSIANIAESWPKNNMGGAQTTKGGIFLRPGEWEASRKAASLAAELWQNVMWTILGSCQLRWQVPDWYGHGLSEHRTEAILNDLGFPPRLEDLSQCHTSLLELQAGSDRNCIYNQAHLVFNYLHEQYNTTEQMEVEVLNKMVEGSSFPNAFEKVFGVSVSQIVVEFDEWYQKTYFPN
jgi:hypothetical protein